MNNIINTTKKEQSKWSAGFYFGIISGTITTLGLLISLFEVSSKDKLGIKIFASGIIGLALSDSFSDGLGLYYSNRGKGDDVNQSQEIGLQTTLYKIIFTMSFLPIMILLPSIYGLIVSIIWTHSLIIYATLQIENDYNSVGKHLIILWVVIIMGYLGGNLANYLF